MQYGLCCDPELAPLAARVGFGFCEWMVAPYLRPRESHEAFAAARAAVGEAGLACPAVNCFVPGDLKITGPQVDPTALERYVMTTCRRAQEAGIDLIVLGSGGARRIPDGFDRAEAHDQIVAFCTMLGPVAAGHGVTIAIEPLNTAVCNVLNTVDECAAMVREVDHHAIRLLVDSFHLLKDDDSLESITAHGELLAHVHVSTVPGGRPPGAEPCDLGPFFDALVAARYEGRVSIEAKMSRPDDELPNALALMCDLEQRAKQRWSNTVL